MGSRSTRGNAGWRVRFFGSWLYTTRLVNGRIGRRNRACIVEELLVGGLPGAVMGRYVVPAAAVPPVFLVEP